MASFIELLTKNFSRYLSLRQLARFLNEANQCLLEDNNAYEVVINELILKLANIKNL